MAKKERKVEFEIPEGVEVSVEKGVFTFKGERGEAQRDLFHPRIEASVEDGKVVLKAKKETNRERKMLHTYRTHIKNLMKGVSEGVTYRMKACASHFPMNLSCNDNEFKVENFLGEKTPRTMDIPEEVDVEIDGDEVVLEGVDKERVGQTAAMIEKLTRRKGFDHRIFQDGIYITEKDGKELV